MFGGVGGYTLWYLTQYLRLLELVYYTAPQLLNDGSVGGSELEEMGKSADEVSHTISVSTSALLAF